MTPVMCVDSTGSDWNSFWTGVSNWFRNNWQQMISGFEIFAGLVCAFIPGLQGACMVLLNMGISSLIAGYTNQMTGGSFSAGWYGGQISGFFSSFGGFAFGFVGGSLGNLTTGLIDKYYYKKDIALESIYWGSLFSGIVNGIFTLASPSKGDFAFKVPIESDWYNLAAFSYSLIFSGLSAFRTFILGLVAGYFPNITKRIF